MFDVMIQRVWTADKGTPLPDPKSIVKGTRATFVGSTWTAHGWSEFSPGFVLWFTDQRDGGPRVMYGEKAIDALRQDPGGLSQATFVHAFSHRYAMESESIRDRQTWHAGVLVEWNHGLYTTLIELAWRGGLGGYGGKSNWVEDKLEKVPKLYGAMPDSMKFPWDSKRAEVRLFDMPARNKGEFESYLHKYSNHSGLPLDQQRFVEPRIYASGVVRLRSCTQIDLVGYLLNYIHRAYEYAELTANCQTFAADLFSFLAGVKEHQPFGTIIKPSYKQRTHSFLYMPRT